MVRIFKYLGYLFFLPLWIVQRIVPRNKNIWVFGAWYGQKFSDNSHYLYQYVRAHHPHIKAIWLSRNRQVVETVRKAGGNAYLIYDLHSFYYSLAAKFIFVSSGKRDVNFWCINGAKWIQLWHGSPLKKIGLDDGYSQANSFFQKKIVRVLFPFVYEFNYHFTVSNAPIFTPKMSTAFNIEISNVWETGCPRNDVFFETAEDTFNRELRKRFKGCRLIYYLPTFRGTKDAESLFSITGFDRNELENFLTKNNMVFVSKGHFVDNSLVTINSTENERLIDLNDSDVAEINFMLKDADLLITDYSSAYFDFLLTGRPIIHAAFDLETYLKGSREMYIDYSDAVAGPIVKNWQELYNVLEYIWEDKENKDLLIRKNKLYNRYHDNKNAERVYDAVISQQK